MFMLRNKKIIFLLRTFNYRPELRKFSFLGLYGAETGVFIYYDEALPLKYLFLRSPEIIGLFLRLFPINKWNVF